jgi:hypothetical protein
LLNIITYFKRIKRRYEKIREKEWEKKKERSFSLDLLEFSYLGIRIPHVSQNNKCGLFSLKVSQS